MWEVPRYRIRRYLRKVRKARAEAPQEPKQVFHVKRTQAELTLLEGLATRKSVIQASIILNDLTPFGLMLFSEHPLYIGQRVGLTIEAPKLFYARGTVTACKNMELHRHIYGETYYAYRVAIKFEFHSTEEERAVARYCQELYRRHLYGNDF
jgi:hypothetical protein